jgi:hypothetical protein
VRSSYSDSEVEGEGIARVRGSAPNGSAKYNTGFTPVTLGLAPARLVGMTISRVKWMKKGPYMSKSAKVIFPTSSRGDMTRRRRPPLDMGSHSRTSRQEALMRARQRPIYAFCSMVFLTTLRTCVVSQVWSITHLGAKPWETRSSYLCTTPIIQ